MTDFSNVVSAIAKGLPVSSEELLPHICQESKGERVRANYKIAEAYFEAENFTQAKVFIQRAWDLSEFAEECVPLFIKIHSALNDIASVREVHKRLGIKKASGNDIGGALDCFNSWQYADALHYGIDSYHYDYDILDCISDLATPFVFQNSAPAPLEGRKIRIAYLLYGIGQINSVLVKHSLSFAQFHDEARFEVAFFVPDQESKISRNEEARNQLKAIQGFHRSVSMAPDSDSEGQSLIALAASIHAFNPDIMVTSAALADLRHCFIASLRPAPLIVGLCQGPPPQYISPTFDWSISWTKHPLMDCPTECSLVAGGIVLPERHYTTEYAKRSMDIDARVLVLLSCGRPSKFQDVGYWKAIIDVVKHHSHVCYVAVGLSQLPDFLPSLIPVDLKDRIKTLSWQKDFLKILSMADVMVDTYPSGGGVAILDAMALGIPVISFKNNYMQVFTQTDWSPAEEFMGVPELLVERGNFDQFKNLISRLITDHGYREILSRRCVEAVNTTSGHPEIMVGRCEDVYVNVLKRKLAGKISEFDVAKMLPPLPEPKTLFSRALGRLKREWKSYSDGVR